MRGMVVGGSGRSHPQNHIGVVVYEGWSLVRDSYTNRMHSPSHEMWSYERDGRWWEWSFVSGSTVALFVWSAYKLHGVITWC